MPLSELHRYTLDTYREEFRELIATWNGLDTKAQGLGAIAGIFLAAAFAWAKQQPGTLGNVGRLSLVALILLLIAAVVAAVRALQIRTIASAPYGDVTAHMFADIERCDKAEAPARITGFYNDQMSIWRIVNDNIRGHILKKGQLIANGQFFLLLAAMLAGILAITSIIKVD